MVVDRSVPKVRIVVVLEYIVVEYRIEYYSIIGWYASMIVGMDCTDWYRAGEDSDAEEILKMVIVRMLVCSLVHTILQREVTGRHWSDMPCQMPSTMN